MKVVWAQFALEDRRRLYEHIEVDSPRAAAAVDARIAEAVARLKIFPESGRPGRIPDTREVVVPRTPCVVAYRVHADRVRVLRVLHGAQMWPDSAPE